MTDADKAPPPVGSGSTNEQKYQSTNPLQRALIRRFQKRLCQVLEPLEFQTVLDVGCGEGFLDRVLLDRFPGIELTGVDASAAALSVAKTRCPEATFHEAAIEGLDEILSEEFDLVVCSEVLEHLPRPDVGLHALMRRCGGHALLTVPWEPWFQIANFARGKYFPTLGNHPEHVQRWTLRGFETFAITAFTPLRIETRFPWTLFLGATRNRS